MNTSRLKKLLENALADLLFPLTLPPAALSIMQRGNVHPFSMREKVPQRGG